MKKAVRGEITTYGVDVTNKTPKEVQDLAEALDDPSSPVFKAMFLSQLRDAQDSLLRGPDYKKLNALLDEMDKRKVA